MAAPEYAALKELQATFEAIGEALESGNIQAGINAIDVYLAVYDCLPPEDQVTAAREKTAADSYQENLVAAQEAKEHNVEHEDEAINLLRI